MNLHALRIFYETAKAGSITGAAEVLRVSQPAVTSQIKRFEKEIGMRLFAARGRGISLTDAGRKLLDYARKLFALEEEMEAFIDGYTSGRNGAIRLVSTYLPANFLLPAWVAKFKRDHEEVDFVITTTNSRGAFDSLLNYEAEIAVYGGAGERRPGIHWEELFEDELWFVVPARHKYANEHITLAEMVKEPFIMREEGSSTREWLFSLCRVHNVSPPQIALQFNGLNETISAVMAGYGTNFISSLVVRDHVQRGELARVYVEDIRLKNIIAVCTRTDEVLSPPAERFIQMIKASVGAGQALP
ncbi:LysR family transcriptional regulator [Paenibacillus chitinolyticus]|uniref:LysR family transcriptional regulator n=1 Tax=Paenibacillus chitinolyticus TaxID=79263 RepID=UPI002DBB6F93|nr:LysR family transcriptional regulator [Paenibacillus chitinolyticus]MEC0248920.1 LysR family transcriptional regulator [Paenibacillus chitinolyticus]